MKLLICFRKQNSGLISEKKSSKENILTTRKGQQT